MDYSTLKDFPQGFLWGGSSSAISVKVHGMKMENHHLYPIQLPFLKVQQILK